MMFFPELKEPAELPLDEPGVTCVAEGLATMFFPASNAPAPAGPLGEPGVTVVAPPSATSFFPESNSPFEFAAGEAGVGTCEA